MKFVNLTYFVRNMPHAKFWPAIKFSTWLCLTFWVSTLYPKLLYSVSGGNLISGSVVISRFHQSSLFGFSRLIAIVLPSFSSSHVNSVCLTSPFNSPSIIAGWPFRPTNNLFFNAFTMTSRGLTAIARGTLNFIRKKPSNEWKEFQKQKSASNYMERR